MPACSAPSAQDLWQDYQSRLARLTRAEVPAAAPVTRPRWPDRRELLTPLPEWRTGLLGWLDLLDCDLMELVAERNSVLGRVQVPARRFLYEQEFLRRGETCLENPDLDPELRDWLQELLASKRDALPVLYHNATLASDELRNLLATGPVPDEPPLWPTSRETVQALSMFAREQVNLRQGQPARDADQLAASLELLDKTRAGVILDGMALAVQELGRASSMLEQVDTTALCPRGRASQRARWLRNVLDHVYAARVQPWLSDVWRNSGDLEQALTTLAEASGNPPVIRDWLDAIGTDQGLRHKMSSALSRHTEAWQQLLGDCGLMPEAAIGSAP